MSEAPLVSIVINNFNYARFLGEAIDSALDQTYSNVEVVVVDDGSTDDSPGVIASYGNRIIPVLKENGGQGSALNAGFASSGGDVVIFLDADDVLLKEAADRVVEAFKSQPTAAKVQYKLRVVNEHSEPTPELIPLGHRQMPSGDLRQHVARFHQYNWPPMSGNAFASESLSQMLPMPEDTYRINADSYLNNLSAVFGPVLSLNEVGGLYRVHGKNNYRSVRSIKPTWLRQLLLAEQGCRDKQKQFLNALYSMDLEEAGKWDTASLRTRLASLRLDPTRHPFKDSALRLCVQGCISSMIYPELRRRERLLYASWFVAMLFAPRGIAKTLTEKLFLSENRGAWLKRLVSFARRAR